MSAHGLAPILNVSSCADGQGGRGREMHVRHPDGHVFRVRRGFPAQ